MKFYGLPNHVEVYRINGIVARGFFYEQPGGFEFIFDVLGHVEKSNGRFPTMMEANEELVRQLSARDKGDPLAYLREEGAQLLATRTTGEKPWSVLAGRKTGFEDTGLRYNTREEAEAAIGKH